MDNPVVHFEINGTEAPAEGPGVSADGGVGGSQDGQPHVTPYAQVDDFATYLERAEALGGGTATPPTEASRTTFAQLRDPQGLLFGLWKPAE